MTATTRRWTAATVAATLILAGATIGLVASSGGRGAPARPRTHGAVRHEAGTAVGTPSAKASKAKYGGIPSWLPKAKVRVDQVVIATPAHPRLAIEGDTIVAHLPRGRAMITAVGPAVPEEGGFPVPQTTPCRFAVTFASVHGAIPISSDAFSFLSEHGQTHRARVRLRGGGPAPKRIAPGHPVTLTVSAVLPTGNGQLRWTPSGERPFVSWDFDAEID